ncbi:MAG TPA: nuclear transport factor 2 family protein [Anaerolineaceae bacterium]
MLLRDCFAALEAGHFEDAAGYLSDDFTFSGPVPEPVGKKEFVGLQTGLITGIPDWKFNLHNVRTQGDTITCTVQITGTHTATLPALMPGASAVPPTGKHFSLPEEPARVAVRDGKMTSLAVDQVPGGGVMGIFQQLGIPMHA